MEKLSAKSAFNAAYTIFVMFLFNGIGSFISKAISQVIVIPGNIIGIILLFLSLQMGIVNFERLHMTGSFLLRNISLFFIPFAVSILKYYTLISGKAIQFFLVILVSTVLALVLTALIIDRRSKGVSR